MKKLRVSKIVLSKILFLLVFTSCLDPFRPELDNSDSEYILVVDGLISNEPGSFIINLSRSVPLDSFLTNSINESGAYVSISDDHNNTYQCIEEEPGLYKCSDEDAKAIVGRSYQLSIIDSEGCEYESESVLMKETPDISELNWEEKNETVIIDNTVTEQRSIDVFINTIDRTNSTKFFKWDISETWEIVIPAKVTSYGEGGELIITYRNIPEEKKYCWVTSSLQNVLVESVENQSISNLEHFVINRLGPGDDKLDIRYSIEVRQYSLNEKLYNYWKNIREINQNMGTIFDRVPLSVYGNINGCNNDRKVLGYFYAADVKKKRIFIEKHQHKIKTINKYENCFLPIPGPDHFCADCRNYGNSEKPEFW